MDAQTSLLTVAMAPPLSMGMLYCVAGQSIGLLMENAVFNEKLSQITCNASVAQCCALMIAAGATKG